MRRLALAAALAFAGLGLAPGAAPAAGEGPYGTTLRTYDLGRETFLVEATPSSRHRWPTRLQGELTLPVGAPGRRPVAVFLHGAHQSCEVPEAFFPTQDWPCRPGFFDVESFRGYRYAARLLASHGFVVLSLDGNPVAPSDGGVLTFPDGTETTPRTWMDVRAHIVDAHLRRLARAARGETGDEIAFGARLAGRVDLGRVGLVGHSRGGEGVVWASLLPGPRPYELRALVALAPVDFFRRLVPDHLPFAVVLPACDGDVFDLQGGWFYDDARARPRTAPLWQVVALGGNHNFFNRVWEDETGFAFPPPEEPGEVQLDPCSPLNIGRSRLSREQQEAFGAATMVPFLRTYVAGASASLVRPLGIDGPPPSTIEGARVAVSYQPPSARRLDVVRPADSRDLARNLLGGLQTHRGLHRFGLCRYDPGTINRQGEVRGCGFGGALQAHAIVELRLTWDRPGGRLVTNIPPGSRDVSAYDALTLRVVPDPGDARRNPPRAPRPFSVALVDTEGRRKAIAVRATNPAVRYPVRVAVLATVRIPLTAFAGVDLDRVASIQILLDRRPRGRLFLTDVSFVR